MAEVNERVMSMVEEELGKNPNVSTDELYQKAKKIDKGIDGLTARQFNARYPLQVKRRTAPKRRKRATGRKATGGRARRGGGDNGARAEIRAVLLQLAKDLSSADDMTEVIGIVADIDKYVDRIEKVKR